MPFTQFGNPRVLHRQVEHVLRLIDDHPRISIRVVSATAADSPAPRGGFALVHFPKPAPPVGFISVLHGPSLYLDEPTDTEALAREYARLREMAWDKAESRFLLERSLSRS